MAGHKQEGDPLAGYTKKFLKAHPEINADAFRALQHEVTEQFPETVAVHPSGPVKHRQAEQLPFGVTAEDMMALRGEQP